MKAESKDSLDKIRDDLLKTRRGVMELFQKRRKGEISQTEYDEEYERMMVRIVELEKEECDTKRSSVESQLKARRLEEAQSFLSGQEKDITDDHIIRTLLTCIKVNNKHELEFQFKCDLNIIENI